MYYNDEKCTRYVHWYIYWGDKHMEQENNKNTTEKKSHGCLVALLVLMVIGFLVFMGYRYIQSELIDNATNSTNRDGSGKWFSRSATPSDITVNYELDLSSFGMKGIVLPNKDIENLELTIIFFDKNDSALKTVVKYIGNVKEGVQVSFSISIAEIGLSAAWNAEYTRVTVTGGTVSYFQ